MAEQITAICPDCSSPQSIPAESQGKFARCVSCNTIYQVPGGDTEPSDDQDWQSFGEAESTLAVAGNAERWADIQSTQEPVYVGRDSARPRAASSSNRRSKRWLLLCALIGLLILLAAIVWPALYGVVESGTGSRRISREVSQLHMAIESYRQRFGEHPPDFSDWEVVKRHVRRAFPRHSENLDPTLQVGDDGAKLEDIDPAEALVFWLSCLKNDPRHPITGSGEPLIIFAFDEMRLWDFDGDGWWEYVPGETGVQETPYVYFDSRTYSQARYPREEYDEYPQGVAYPYRTTALLTDLGSKEPRVNPNTFQIISAGMDGDYGADDPVKLFPRGAGYGPGDWDNVANFSDGKTLESWAPK